MSTKSIFLVRLLRSSRFFPDIESKTISRKVDQINRERKDKEWQQERERQHAREWPVCVREYKRIAPMVLSVLTDFSRARGFGEEVIHENLLDFERANDIAVWKIRYPKPYEINATLTLTLAFEENRFIFNMHGQKPIPSVPPEYQYAGGIKTPDVSKKVLIYTLRYIEPYL